jgi:hypothetical protein
LEEDQNYCTIPEDSNLLSRPSSIHEYSSSYVAFSSEEASSKDSRDLNGTGSNSIVSIVSRSSLEQQDNQTLTYTHDKPLPELSEPAQSQPVTAEAKKSMRGLHALQELMETERAFVKDLRILVKVIFSAEYQTLTCIWLTVSGYQTCLEPLEEISWIPIEHKQLLVRNGQAILEFQTKFLDALEEAYHTEPYAQDKDSYKADLRAIARCFSQLVGVDKEQVQSFARILI